MILVSGTVIGKYVIVRPLGQGSFGTVYEARDTLMDRVCALKFVANSDPRQFVAHYEAQVLHKCRHDRIVSIHSVDVLAAPNGVLYAVIDMEYCPEGSIDKKLGVEFFSVRKSIKAAVDILFGLEHAHRNNVLHRDVKPANVMIVGKHCKLSDFGLAKLVLTGSGKGSPVYSAPETLNSDITNISTEIYSVGMTFFQMCNNYPDLGLFIHDRNPIKAGKVIATIGYRPYIPSRVQKFCSKACALNPTSRFASVEDMRQYLEKMRVEEDWYQVSEMHWRANIHEDLHEIVGDIGRHCESVYLINRRRKNPKCRSFANKAELIAFQNDFVKHNCLRK